MAWKIKRFSNDELRQKFIDVTVPQAEFLGLKVPDDKLRLDEASGRIVSAHYGRRYEPHSHQMDAERRERWGVE